MPERPTNLEKTTQTDLLYGMSQQGDSAVAMLEGRQVQETADHAAPVDAALENAATRTDLSLQISASGPAKGRSRWRFRDGIAPAARPTVIDFPQYAVVDRPLPLSPRRIVRQLWRSSSSWLISFTTHVVLLPLLVLLTMAEPAQRFTSFVQATHATHEVLEVIPPPVPAALPTPVEFHSPRIETLEVSLPTPRVDPGAMHGQVGTMATFAPQSHRGPVDDVQRLFGQAGQGQARRGKGQGSAEFFGAKASGDRFVFVVDCSFSMAEKERWISACLELNAAIERLKPEQLFYVVLFDGTVHRMFQHDERQAALFPATEENKERFRTWLSGVRLGPETRPFLAVKCAMDLNPDAIYLLSDGEFHDATADYLEKFNRARDEQNQPIPQVVVHTIALHNTQAAVLKRISRQNGGEHVYVRPK